MDICSLSHFLNSNLDIFTFNSLDIKKKLSNALYFYNNLQFIIMSYLQYLTHFAQLLVQKVNNYVAYPHAFVKIFITTQSSKTQPGTLPCSYTGIIYIKVPNPVE